jgi:hypothetical protein
VLLHLRNGADGGSAGQFLVKKGASSEVNRDAFEKSGKRIEINKIT